MQNKALTPDKLLHVFTLGLRCFRQIW